MAKTIVVTGASSGLGEALALRYARDGARLGLIGRNRERLAGVAGRCRAAGAVLVDCGAVDMRSRAEVDAWIRNFGERSPIDLLIANAGVTGGTTPDGAVEQTEDSHRIFEINVFGVVNAVHAVLPDMLRRGSGQIAVVSSLAAIMPLPDAPSYSASKSAVMTYGLALREAVRGKGIRVSVVCPGYIDTPMSRQLSGAKPLMVTPENAAEAIHGGLARDKRLIAFPSRLAWLTQLGALLPAWLNRRTLPSFRVTPRESD